jgi:hypothetical protein
VATKTTLKTDYGAEADPDDLVECRYCGQEFDSSREGHIDDATGIAFCDAPCEMHYDQDTGLPRRYKRA